MTFAKSKHGEIYQEWGDNDLVEDLDTSNMGKSYANELYSFIEVRQGKVEAHKDRACTELNFTKVTLSRGRGNPVPLAITRAVPRYQDFMKSDTIMEIKTQIYERIKYMYSPKQQEEANEEWINKAINLNIKDNTPHIKGKYGNREKMKCEFCGETHNGRNDCCDIRTNEHGSGNDLEIGKVMKLQDLYDMLKTNREIVLEV